MVQLANKSLTLYKENFLEAHNNRLNLVKNYLDKIELEKELEDYYLGRNILVTGGAGAIGSNLIIALSLLVGEQGKIIVLDNISSIKTTNPWNVLPLANIMFVEGRCSK